MCSHLQRYAFRLLEHPSTLSSTFLRATFSACGKSRDLSGVLDPTDTNCRMILYFPVSALVTLFANILQNPQDPRARADVKLMNLVVNFLSMLVSDEENGSVKRMLGVCAEFERIAKIVLDKADRDSHTRRKRKTVPDDVKMPQAAAIMNPNTPVMPNMNQSHHSTPQSQQFSPNANSNRDSGGFNPALGGSVYSPPPGLMSSMDQIPMMPEFGNDFSNMMGSPNAMAQGFPGIPVSNGSPFNPGSFQQPFVPQDLWQMPMTLEWDWADMTSFDQQSGMQ